MTTDMVIWRALHSYLPRKTWIPIADIYGIVRLRISLDAEDLGSGRARSTAPMWQRNVRRVLHSKLRDGTLRNRKRQ
jgi:hypothetical protein